MRTTRIVEVAMSDIIACATSGGEYGFLVLLEKLFFAEDSEEDSGILEDVVFKAVGVTAEGLIRIEVTATIEPF